MQGGGWTGGRPGGRVREKEWINEQGKPVTAMQDLSLKKCKTGNWALIREKRQRKRRAKAALIGSV